ncbi:MAG: Rieske (2Fe-2S) protein [Fimbriimonas sp.]|nr:Rieske (2Fe-2S) protein [Fimbriimonas sp.]
MSQFEPNQEEVTSRRLFLGGVFAFLASVALIALGSFRFLVPNVIYGKNQRFKIGVPKDFPDKQATYLPEQQIFIVRDGETFMALSSVCTHLGCAVRTDPDKQGFFFCPCHGSKFKPDGTNYAGPAPKPLSAYEISMNNQGELVVDKRVQISPKEKYHI